MEILGAAVPAEHKSPARKRVDSEFCLEAERETNAYSGIPRYVAFDMGFKRTAINLN